MSNNEIINDDQFVVFRLGRETYGLDIATVLEIIKMQTITEVPGTEVFVEGVINLRGKVIPVFNLYKKFKMVGGEMTDSTRIVVVETHGNNIGMLVDEVLEVVSICKDVIEPPAKILNGVGEEYLKGIAKIDNGLVILVDLDKVLQKEESNVLDSIG